MNKLRISGKHYQELKRHLFSGDGKEAVALAVCGRSINHNEHTLLVKEIFCIPYEVCYERRDDFVHWPTDFVNPLLEKAIKKGLAILKIHSHPTNYEDFSLTDNESDETLFKSIHAWLDDNQPHASCIMLPEGRIFGRFFNDDLIPKKIHQISVAGSDILNWYYSEKAFELDQEALKRNQQAFGKRTTSILSRLKIGVIGCSGTGSPTIEQLKRLGVGQFVLVDPDYIDTVNLNRIIGSTKEDASNKLPKVDVMEREISKLNVGTKVIKYNSFISNISVIKELASCDILFGCVDSAEGRHIMSLIASHYLIPYFDLGVKFDPDDQGGINAIFGSVHYIQPFGSSLLTRGQYDIETVRAEEIKRLDPEEFSRNNYLAKVNESSPAVISVNTQVSSTAVNEFLARIHPYRNLANSDVDIVRIQYADCVTYPEVAPEPCPFFSTKAGVGDTKPLLGLIELSRDAAKVH